MTVTTDALIPALEDARDAHAAVIDRLRADVAVTPLGPHRQTLEQHAAQTQDHIARIDDHVRAIRPHNLLRDTGEMALTATAGAFHAAMLPMHIGTRMVRGILPGRPLAGEHQLLKNTKDEYTATARALAACRAGESIATLAQDEQAAALLSALRQQDEQLIHTLESNVEDQALALAATAAGNGRHAHGGLTDAAARTVRTAVDRLRQAARIGGQQTARSAGDAARDMPAVTQEQNLPISGYGQLTVTDIIQRLRPLSQADLTVVEGYERAHGDRVGVLNAIENLRGNQPWSGYDTMSPDQITARLQSADPLLARQAMHYEKRHRQRPDIISAAKQRTRTTT
jgi:hypothetical protein